MGRFSMASRVAVEKTNREIGFTGPISSSSAVLSEEQISRWVAVEKGKDTRQCIEWSYPDGAVCVATGRIPFDWALIAVFFSVFFILGWIQGSREKR